jgi:hypothetical protein
MLRGVVGAEAIFQVGSLGQPKRFSRFRPVAAGRFLLELKLVTARLELKARYPPVHSTDANEPDALDIHANKAVDFCSDDLDPLMPNQGAIVIGSHERHKGVPANGHLGLLTETSKME